MSTKVETAFDLAKFRREWETAIANNCPDDLLLAYFEANTPDLWNYALSLEKRLGISSGYATPIRW